MPLKILYLPHSGRTVKMGRTRPEPPAKPPLRFESLVGAVLPAPPQTLDYSGPALGSLRKIYLNDREGCCVVSGYWHVKGVWTGNAGDLVIATDAEINADYGKIGGYVPGDESTDNGCDEETAFSFWMANPGPDGSRLVGRLAVDATNPTLLRQALYLFENLYFGIELPDRWVNPFPQGDGFVWDAAGSPDPENGHCVMGYGYTGAGVLIDSWALFGTITWAAIAAYATAHAGGQVYTLVSDAMIARAQQKAPNGFDWRTLITDFNAMGGNLPLPPTPTPTPPVPVDPPAPVPPPAPSPAPSPLPANAVILDLDHGHVSVPAGVTAVHAFVPQVTYYPFRRQVGVPPGWTCATHQGANMTPESIEAAIGEHLPAAPEAPHPHSAAAALPPEAWVALAQALGPIVTPIIQAILNRFNHQPAPAPAPAPAAPSP